jgi:hypothetical protein
VSEFWLSSLLRTCPLNLRQLREDRILDEARASDADPLHLSAMLGAQAGRYTQAVHTENHRTGPDSRTPTRFPQESGVSPAEITVRIREPTGLRLRLFFASRVRKAPTRRAAWKEKSAGSGAGT